MSNEIKTPELALELDRISNMRSTMEFADKFDMLDWEFGELKKFAQTKERETVELRAEVERIKSLEGYRAMAAKIVTALEERDAARSELKTAVSLLGELTELSQACLDNAHWEVKFGSGDLTKKIKETTAFLESNKTK